MFFDIHGIATNSTIHWNVWRLVVSPKSTKEYESLRGKYLLDTLLWEWYAGGKAPRRKSMKEFIYEAEGFSKVNA